MKEIQQEIPLLSQEIDVPPLPSVELEPWQLNQLQFGKMKTQRETGRRAIKLITIATLQCTQHINAFFKFASVNKDIQAQSDEIIRLDKLWKNYVRSNSDKYTFKEVGLLFARKLSFLIDPKIFTKEQIEQIKSESENSQSSNS